MTLKQITVKDKDFFHPIDMKLYGRCYTFLPSLDLVKSGIFKIKLHLRTQQTKIRVFVNSNGVLRVKKAAETQFLDVDANTNLHFNVDHNLYEMLNSEKKPCVDEKDYSLDECIFTGCESSEFFFFQNISY